jgi:hypothetical protein
MIYFPCRKDGQFRLGGLLGGRPPIFLLSTIGVFFLHEMARTGMTRPTLLMQCMQRQVR